MTLDEHGTRTPADPVSPAEPAPVATAELTDTQRLDQLLIIFNQAFKTPLGQITRDNIGQCLMGIGQTLQARNEEVGHLDALMRLRSSPRP